jgi:hypothetical protein
MKVKVKSTFIDKHTNEKYEPGKVIEITEERYDEITAVGDLVAPVKETKKKEDK